MASVQGPQPGSTAHRVGLSLLCGGTSGSDPLSSRVRKLFWVVRGRTYGLEFWHLLHRHAESTSRIYGSGRLFSPILSGALAIAGGRVPSAKERRGSQSVLGWGTVLR